MEVDLSTFFSVRGGLVNSDNAELVVARAFAAAANATRTAHQHIAAPELIAVELRLHYMHAVWTRKLKDVMLRCVDRAMNRVYPPLDVLQYLSEDSPAFVSGSDSDDKDSMKEGVVRVVFRVCPTAAFFFPASLLKPHTVEGEVVPGFQLPELEDVAALTAAASETMKNTLSDMDLWYRARAAHQQYDSSIPLDSLQQLASSLPGSTGTREGAVLLAQQQQQEAKLESLRWQLARWLTELFLNEGGWAKPRRTSSPSSATSSAPSRRENADAATRRLFHAPLRLAYPDVVDAAVFSVVSVPKASTDGTAMPEGGPRRQLHADVRGMEWDGLLLGYTTRYAYIAVPYFVSASEVASPSSAVAEPACVWSLVSRVPVPVFLRHETSVRFAEGDGEESEDGHSASSETTASATAQAPGGGGATRKRRRAAVDEVVTAPHQSDDRATLAQTVLSRCFNAEEVMRHDTNAAAAFRLTDVPYIVTVRAHRVYCARADATKQPSLPSFRGTGTGASTTTTPLCAKKPHPVASPYKLSIVLEDAYAVTHRIADAAVAGAASSSSQLHWAASLFGVAAARGSSYSSSSMLTAAVSSSLVRSLHTFPDVVSVVRESCHRFVRSHERLCSLYARCLDAKKLHTTAAALKQVSAVPADGEADRAGANEDAVLEEGASAKMSASGGERSPPAVAPQQQQQQLRLLRCAEAVYAAIADSMSVHYKKLRGASRVALPAVRTSADVLLLEEGNNVEFKAKVGLTAGAAASAVVRGSGRHASTMDTERLRNTIAAMAACRGGVILIGVADDGHVVAHARQLEVSRHLRLSGFCPAMVKDAVQVKELRWLPTTINTAASTTVTAAGGVAADVPAKRTMPENWWKVGNSTSSADAAVKTGAQKPHGNAAGEQVITVISVEKGQAPFYAAAKNTPPYQRGCASTVVMPTVVLARRLMKELV